MSGDRSGENWSVHYAAYTLLKDIARVERKTFDVGTNEGEKPANKKWILDIYSECLEAVLGKRANQTAVENLESSSKIVS